MRNRPIVLLIALVVLSGAPAWAPSAVEHHAQVTSQQKASTTRLLLRAPDRAYSLSREPLADYDLHLPSNWQSRQPLRVLVALHGMGDTGEDFVRPLLPRAEEHGWAVLAPTIAYRDYRDPSMVRKDGENLPRLKALLDTLPARYGIQFQPEVLLFGFSRGSQEAHRFSFMYPEATLGVAGMSAGSYTLPLSSVVRQGAVAALKYPFGIQDVDAICGRSFNSEAAQKVKYWVAVGGRDTKVEDVPRQWDQYLGNNRVERAQSFVGALKSFGAQAQYALFPEAVHEVTESMRRGAVDFLVSVERQHATGSPIASAVR